MTPFNFPNYLSIRTIAPALALDNTVVHKADLQCGLVSGSVIAKAFEEAGLPSGAFQSLLTNSKVIGDKIGRASCRESGGRDGGFESAKAKKDMEVGDLTGGTSIELT